LLFVFFFFSSRRRHTRFSRDWSSDVCSSDLHLVPAPRLWPPLLVLSHARRETPALGHRSVGSGCRDTPPLRLSSSKVSDRGPATVVQRGDVRVPECVLVVEDGSVELLAERRRPVVLDRVVHPERPKLRHGGLGHLRPAARVVRTLCRVAEDRLDARRVLLAPCGRQLRLYALAELLEWLAVGDGLVE